MLTFLILPLLLPFLKITNISAINPIINTITLPEIQLNQFNNHLNSNTLNSIYLYFGVSLILFFRLCYKLYHTYNNHKDKPIFLYKNHRIIELKEDKAYNFLNQIYVGYNFKSNTNILEHEIIHKKAKHSLDLLIISILKTIFWIFPFWNFILRLFKENHEFYVDQKLLKTIKLSDYLKQIALAGPFKFEEQFAFTSNQMSIFKTRLQMMKNNHKSHLWRYLLMLGISGGIIASCNKTTVESENTTPTNRSIKENLSSTPPSRINTLNEEATINMSKADVFPVWKGCEEGDRSCFHSSLFNHIQKEYTYPKQAKALKEEGKAFVEFIISSNGEIMNISLKKKTNSELLNKEALRLIKSIPRMYKPAYKDGKPIAVRYIIPINFKLS